MNTITSEEYAGKRTCRCGSFMYDEEAGMWFDKTSGKKTRVGYCDKCNCFLDDDGLIIGAITD